MLYQAGMKKSLQRSEVMGKYKLAKKLNILKFFKSPMNRFFILIGNVVLSILPTGMRSGRNLTIDKKQIQARDGAKITTYIISPKGKENENLPCMVYFHGGAFVYRGGFLHYSNARKYALGANIKVVYVEYRLALKYKYPIPQNDCIDAYNWVCENTDELFIDKSKIFVGGDSAGAALALGVVMNFNHLKNLPVAQFLVYPVVDSEMRSESAKYFVDTPVWDSHRNEKMWKYFLGKESNYVSAIDFENKKIFPKTYIETTEFDPLHDEGVMFFELIEKDKILNETKRTVHGYDFVRSAEVTKESMQKRIDFLKNV